MASLLKLIKNTTGSDIDLTEVGLTILAGDSHLVELDEVLRWATPDALSEITPFLNSGDLVVNDGITDLSAAEGARFLEYSDRPIYKKDGVVKARYPREVNLTGNVTVEETPQGTVKIGVLDSADVFDGQLFVVGFTSQGSSGDKWMKLIAEDHESDEINFTFPYAAELIGINYANKKEDTRFELDIHRALSSSGSSDSRIFRWSQNFDSRVATQRTGANTDVTNLTDVTFAIGDKMGVFIGKNGGEEPDNAAIMLWFRITNSALTDTLENYSGKF